MEQADVRLRFLPSLTRFRFYHGASECCQARSAIQEISMIAPQTLHVKRLARALLYPAQDWHAVLYIPMRIRHAQVQEADNNQRNALSYLLQILNPGFSFRLQDTHKQLPAFFG